MIFTSAILELSVRGCVGVCVIVFVDPCQTDAAIVSRVVRLRFVHGTRLYESPARKPRLTVYRALQVSHEEEKWVVKQGKKPGKTIYVFRSVFWR